jgi:hypothetical protein
VQDESFKAYKQSRFSVILQLSFYPLYPSASIAFNPSPPILSTPSKDRFGVGLIFIQPYQKAKFSVTTSPAGTLTVWVNIIAGFEAAAHPIQLLGLVISASLIAACVLSVYTIQSTATYPGN